MNNSAYTEKYKFNFTADGLKVEIPNELENSIEIPSNQTIEFSINITPIKTGSAKIIVQIDKEKMVKYTALVWKIREQVPNEIIGDALSQKYYSPKFDFSASENKLPLKINSKKSPITVQDAQKIVEKLTEEYDIRKEDEYENTTPEKNKKRDKKLAEIARDVFDSNNKYAFQVTHLISDEGIKQTSLAELVLPYVNYDYNDAMLKFMGITDESIRQNLLKKIICGIALKNPEQAIKLTTRIKNSELKQGLLQSLIGVYYRINIDPCISLINSITDINDRFALQYEFIKFLYDSDKDKCLQLAQDFTDKLIQYKKTPILKNLLIIVATLTTPQAVNDMIENFSENFKQIVQKEVYKSLWVQIEEKSTKIEQVPVTSLYYTFNASAHPNKAIEMVSELGGNISENLLSGDFSSFIGILCPFGFEFPIFPTIEACYSEIKNEKQKSFYYMIIPTKFETEQEFSFIKTMLDTWFIKNISNFKNKVYLFNLDFVPYLSKPTIIIGSDTEENMVIQSIVNRVFKDTVSFIIDDGLFKEGMTYNILKSYLPFEKFKILNMVMTYDFLNNYEMLKKFLTEFIK